jgi:hypothetical protein
VVASKMSLALMRPTVSLAFAAEAVGAGVWRMDAGVVLDNVGVLRVEIPELFGFRCGRIGRGSLRRGGNKGETETSEAVENSQAQVWHVRRGSAGFALRP